MQFADGRLVRLALGGLPGFRAVGLDRAEYSSDAARVGGAGLIGLDGGGRRRLVTTAMNLLLMAAPLEGRAGPSLVR